MPRLRIRAVRRLREFVTSTPADRPASSRILYVVARDRPELYAALREKFLESPRLAIVLDRRGESRGAGAAEKDRPAAPVTDDRRHLTVEELLRTRGWARVRIGPDGRAASG